MRNPDHHYGWMEPIYAGMTVGGCFLWAVNPWLCVGVVLSGFALQRIRWALENRRLSRKFRLRSEAQVRAFLDSLPEFPK